MHACTIFTTLGTLKHRLNLSNNFNEDLFQKNIYTHSWQMSQKTVIVNGKGCLAYDQLNVSFVA